MQIEQVLMHLAGNAGDATAEGGSVTIETSSTFPRSSARGTILTLTRSRACGSPCGTAGAEWMRDTRDHVFEPFFTAKSPGLSAGLGLPVVYGVVHQLGGTIAVESEVGRGTTFTIALRRASVNRGGNSALSTTSGALEKPCVDHPAGR